MFKVELWSGRNRTGVEGVAGRTKSEMGSTDLDSDHLSDGVAQHHTHLSPSHKG